MGKPKVNLKRRGSLTRLYGYSSKFLKEIGQAFQQSRLNYFGQDRYIKLDDLEIASGVSSSVINSIELSNRETAGMDNIVCLWLVLSEGAAPPLNLRTGKPYRWRDFIDLFELNEERLRQAATVGVRLRKGLRSFSSDASVSSTEEIMETDSRLLQLVKKYREQHKLQDSDEERLVKDLSDRAKVVPHSVRLLLRGEITLEQLSPLEAKLLYSVLPAPENDGEQWSFEAFVFYVTGRHLQKKIKAHTIVLAESLNGTNH